MSLNIIGQMSVQNKTKYNCIFIHFRWSVPTFKTQIIIMQNWWLNIFLKTIFSQLFRIIVSITYFLQSPDLSATTGIKFNSVTRTYHVITPFKSDSSFWIGAIAFLVHVVLSTWLFLASHSTFDCLPCIGPGCDRTEH